MAPTAGYTKRLCVALATIAAAALPMRASEIDPAPRSGASARIDQLVEQQLTEVNEQPNAPINDELFLRRIYLDAIGRIPTVDEARAFLDNPSSTKRAHLIDQLLDSEGRVSHEFNYLADLLRVQSRMQNVPGQDYIDWVKDAVRVNKPYDEMVRELVTAEGYIWENGAAGFYLRDPGMPLDHLATTVQVFLGTQLVCAQCHDHPYDDWSQKQYYELAAYTFGVQTRDQDVIKRLRGMDRRNTDISPQTQRAARQLLRPLTQRVHETDRNLRLPGDYQYDDAKPKSVVEPHTLFGDAMEFAKSDGRRIDQFAEWMTSPENPRFTVVIANRMWQQVFGRALIEPVDDLGDGFKASNPALMSHLTQLMIELDYDLKAFKRILFNTRTYQRESVARDLAIDEDYHFPGPVPRRLTAEQIWDSLVTMAVPEIDTRPGNNRIDARFEIGKSLEGKSPAEIYEVAEQQQHANELRQELQQGNRRLQQQIREAQRLGQSDRVKELRDEQRGNQARLRELRENPVAQMARRNRSQGSPGSEGVWRGYPADLVRASELPSPAPTSHFLHQLGQSDRETIENSSVDATVPQILTFINGPIYNAILREKSVLVSSIQAAETIDGRIENAFLGVLTRLPTKEETALVRESLSGSPNAATADLIWALVNTRQFSFHH